MKQILILSYGFFNKLLSLAENLQQDSQRIIDLMDSVQSDDPLIDNYLKINFETLLSINCRAQLIKEELISSAISQNEVFNDEIKFGESLRGIMDDFQKINAICTEITKPNYYINTGGRLIHMENC